MDSTEDTRNRILDAAEKLFGAKGLDATSVRMIAATAKVNLSAVSYHFGGKEALHEAVFLRRIRPVNEERMQLLEAARAKSMPANPTLEEVMDAFIRPALSLGHKHPAFMGLMSRNISAPPAYMVQKIAKEFEPMIQCFRPSLQASLPHLSTTELSWRMHFVIGSVVHTTAHFGSLQKAALGLNHNLSIDVLVQRLVAFACAGLRQPVTPAIQPA